MNSKQSSTRENRHTRRYNKKSFKAAIVQPEHDASEPGQHRMQQESAIDTGLDSKSSTTSSLISVSASQIERITSMDTTKIALGILLTTAIVLMQYGTRQQTNESILHSSLGTTTFKSIDRVRSSQNSFDDQGHQARSQVPIPMEYSHFVELSEFADTVEALRVHRDKILEEQSQQNQHRRLQKSRDGETGTNGQHDDEEVEMQNAIDKAWDQTLQQADPSQLGQLQTLMPSVKHIPFLWHIPRSGGTTLSTLFGTCLGLVQASSSYSSPAIYTRWEDQELANRFKDPKLYVLHMKRQQFVNVDLNDFQGTMRAVKGGLISNELADVVIVQDVSMGSFLLEEGKSLNEAPSSDNRPEFKGVLFAMFRHPIDRTISSFYSKQQVHDVHFDPSLQIYSLTDWANSPQYINDFMVRSLVGKLNQRSPQNQPPLNRNDLDVAKEILRRKCLVGLFDEKTESLKRFEKFFDWNANVRRDSLVLFGGQDTADQSQAEKWRKEIVKDEECKDRLLHYNWEKKHKHPLPKEGDISYSLLESKNRYDIELYVYARQLFDEQYLQLGFDDEAVMGG